MHEYYVYIMSNHTGAVLYVGLSSDLGYRVSQHKLRVVDGFTKRYKLTKLVYYETTTDVRSAIEREKQIKGWAREKKIALIRSINPTWRDLSEDLPMVPAHDDAAPRRQIPSRR